MPSGLTSIVTLQWCDNSEPFTPEWTHLEKPDPSTMYHEYVQVVSKHLPLKQANAYALVHAQGLYEGQRASQSAKRVVNLTRSSFPGQQRYGTILWSGDIEARWETLRNQLIAGMQFCASGLPYWTFDIGAHLVKEGAKWYWDGAYDEGMDDLGYRELYVRWFQLGAFLPIFRAHGTDVRREMWQVDGEDHQFYQALIEVNRLRYKLLPYIYSLAGNVWRNDGTIMRMLAFDFLDDEAAHGVCDQFMLGSNIMVCPVVYPMYYDVHSKPIKGVPKTQNVYLPKGVQWVDFYTGEHYMGRQTICVSAPLDRIPLFVRAGSILPMTHALESTVDFCMDDVELYIYTGSDGTFDLYNDAGDGCDYENGDYALVHIAWEDSHQKLSIDCSDASGSYFNTQWNPKVHLT